MRWDIPVPGIHSFDSWNHLEEKFEKYDDNHTEGDFSEHLVNHNKFNELKYMMKHSSTTWFKKRSNPCSIPWTSLPPFNFHDNFLFIDFSTQESELYSCGLLGWLKAALKQNLWPPFCSTSRQPHFISYMWLMFPILDRTHMEHFCYHISFHWTVLYYYGTVLY